MTEAERIEEIEAVIACLGDDAAQLREANSEDERAAIWCAPLPCCWQRSSAWTVPPMAWVWVASPTTTRRFSASTRLPRTAGVSQKWTASTSKRAPPFTCIGASNE